MHINYKCFMRMQLQSHHILRIAFAISIQTSSACGQCQPVDKSVAYALVAGGFCGNARFREFFRIEFILNSKTVKFAGNAQHRGKPLKSSASNGHAGSQIATGAVAANADFVLINAISLCVVVDVFHSAVTVVEAIRIFFWARGSSP